MKKKRNDTYAIKILLHFEKKNTTKLHFDDIFENGINKKMTRGQLSSFMQRNGIAMNVGKCTGKGNAGNIWVLNPKAFGNFSNATLWKMSQQIEKLDIPGKGFVYKLTMEEIFRRDREGEFTINGEDDVEDDPQ